MTDAEIIRATAGKVMGWKEFGAEVAYPEVGLIVVVPGAHGYTMQCWNPLASDTDACAIWDELLITHDFVGTQCCDGEWVCNISGHYAMGPKFQASAADRRRAICLAALEAVGVET